MTQARVIWRRVVSTIHMPEGTERLADAGRTLRLNSPWSLREDSNLHAAVQETAALSG